MGGLTCTWQKDSGHACSPSSALLGPFSAFPGTRSCLDIVLGHSHIPSHVPLTNKEGSNEPRNAQLGDAHRGIDH